MDSETFQLNYPRNCHISKIITAQKIPNFIPSVVAEDISIVGCIESVPVVGNTVGGDDDVGDWVGVRVAAAIVGDMVEVGLSAAAVGLMVGFGVSSTRTCASSQQRSLSGKTTSSQN